MIFGLIKIVFAQSRAAQGASSLVNGYANTGGLLGFLSSVAGAILTLFAGMIEWAVKLGQQIIGLDIVRIGAGNVLAFANLGFVLAIIIIAFATIFRVQSYAIKQTLWKLIVAALLVNFSLTIAGAFISVSDVLTNSFLSQIKGGIGTGLAGILEPQILAKVNDNASTLEKIGSFFTSTYWLKYLVSLFFVVIFSFMLVLIFVYLFIMFLIRDIALALLLIIMPIVWLAWIFPGTAKHWQKWWSEFIRWLLFGPIALFFIALVVNTGNQLNKLSANIASQDTVNNINKAFQKNLLLEPGFFAHVGQIFIVGGLLVAGVMVANSLGLWGSKAVYGGVQNAGKMFGGWVGRKGLQYGTSPLRRKGAEEGAKSWSEGIQDWAGKQKGLGRYAAGWLARGTTRLATLGEGTIKPYEKRAAAMTVPDAKAAMLTATGPFKIALTEKLTKAGELSGVDMAGLSTEANKKLFASFGQSKLFGNMEKGGLMSVEMAKEIGKMKAGKQYDQGALLKATEKLASSFVKKDIDSAAFKDLFSGKAKFGLDKDSVKTMSQYVARGFASQNSALVANIIPKLDANSRNNFEKTYRDAAKHMPEVIENFNKTMANYAIGLSAATEAAATETPKT